MLTAIERCVTQNADSKYVLCFPFHMVYIDQYCKEQLISSVGYLW